MDFEKNRTLSNQHLSSMRYIVFFALLTPLFVHSQADTCQVYAPNAISFSEDGQSDGFRITSNCTFKDYDLVVYNRWGMKVYSSTDPLEFWDGEDATKGVYAWILSYNFTDVEEQEVSASGSLTVVR